MKNVQEKENIVAAGSGPGAKLRVGGVGLGPAHG